MSEITSTATATNRRSELTTAKSHEYTICLLGDWAPTAPTKMKPPSQAVHEVTADLESPIVQVSCGSGWNCLLCEDGRAYSFGDNTYGQLGQSHDRPYVAVPEPMSTPFCLQPRRRIIRLSCGSVHGGFVLDVGELYMFGCGSYGRLGTGNEANACLPTLVSMKWSTLLAVNTARKQQNSSMTDGDEDEARFKDISCGDRHTLTLAVRITRANSDCWSNATKSKTSIISFGDGLNGRLGIGDEKDRHEGTLLTTWIAASSVPGVGITGNNGCMAPPMISAICAGSTHNLALSAGGDVFSWGNGVDGQLGHGSAVSEWVPRQLEYFKDISITDISCGASHSMAISQTGVVYTWGRGTEGQLGIDLEDDSTADFVDKTVCLPHPVAILKGSTHRVTVRTIVAKHNMSLALDDRDRMFVWGENDLTQLGVLLSLNTEVGTRAVVPRPKMLSYMDLRSPKSATYNAPTSASLVSSLRDLVAAAKPDPIRLGLTHVDAGDRFTMLVFKTKPGIGCTSNTIGDEISETLGSKIYPDTKTTVVKWNFSLTDDLDFPSRESAYYQFMVNYKVYLRPAVPRRRGDAEEIEEEMDRNRNMQRRSPYRRGRIGSTISKRGSLPTVDPESRFKTTNDDHSDNTGVYSSQAHGFNSSLEKDLISPSSITMVNRFFAPPTSSKKEEVRYASCSSTTRINDTPSIPVKPQQPRSGMCRERSIRRPTVSIGPASFPPVNNQDKL
ncbi:hypothetical protein F442_21298 [Phytophthora nicotianae P10297]|uniref:RCC1-like domain-containing protein n=3 Tax=Phytophthora nicotianae TaxID=4792 RepID=V9DZZ7_PHYNI|nr:hypothetical protein F443_21461 [Phytophthora nicotianae P1569]ETL78620.1 hypothetical protein L917_20599 [Phytophthora nicotianae]ETP29564.1 hypothetical protein F442_21298 [Phytophthora nicotianae P10297]KUF96971.1 hypothetical protein AM588_10006616 [Phytophthora nicotianae]